MKTVLFEQHVEQNAKMGPFGGWNMPIQYEGIILEHQHTRTVCGLFDICHMGEFELSGPGALITLENLLTMNVASLAPGQCRYGFMLNNQGGVLDDLTCYRLDDTRFMLVVNAATTESDAAWIQEHLEDNTTFEDKSARLGKIDVQGPKSLQVMSDLLEKKVPELGYFRFTEITILGAPCILSRTGYTGEWGYEIYCPVDSTVEIWNQLMAHPDTKPIGLGARDTLRMEMGYPLYGHELNEDQSPVGTSHGKFISKKKKFIGHQAISDEIQNGASRYLVGLRLSSRRAARAGEDVFFHDKPVGIITSGSYAPSLGTAAALALLSPDCMDPGTRVSIQDSQGVVKEAEVVSLPLYTEGTARGC